MKKTINTKTLKNIIIKKIPLSNVSLNLNIDTDIPELKISQIINQTNNRKILFNKNINQNILLKVKELNFSTLINIVNELYSFKLLKNSNFPNIVKKKKSVVCGTDKRIYENLSSNKLILCKQGVSNIPIIINILEYVQGESFYNYLEKNIVTSNILKNFILQLFFTFYFMYEKGIDYNDDNLNNFIIQNVKFDAKYKIEGFFKEFSFDYKFILIDFDKVSFNAVIESDLPQETYLGIIFDMNKCFYRIISKLSAKYKQVQGINFENIINKCFWERCKTVDEFIQLIEY